MPGSPNDTSLVKAERKYSICTPYFIRDRISLLRGDFLEFAAPRNWHKN